MTNSLDSSGSSTPRATDPPSPSRVNLALVAAASALAGGLAAAWWYRKTLRKLRQEDEKALNPHFGIPEDDPPEG
jgi:hypothetical protein